MTPAAPAAPRRTRAPRRTERLLLAGLLALASACDDAADPPAGDTPCGSGPLAVAVGTGNPYTAVPDGRFQVEAGLQGGFHFEVSLRLAGAIDADHADIDLTLREGDVVRARHVTADWLLHVDAAGPACEYPRARLVLVDEAGDLFPRERLADLADVPLSLDVRLDSPLGGGTATVPVVLALPERF